MFWLMVIATGLLGAVADIVLSRWSATGNTSDWVASAASYLVFMTMLGLVVRVGAFEGYRLTIAVVLALVVNVAALSLWDSWQRSSFSAMEVVGIVLALGAAACFELSRAS
jgi:hypothetical protein